MIVVQTRTSASPSAKASITFSSAPSGIWPWPTTKRASGQHPPELLGLRLDRLDPVVDVEHLAAAVELAQDRVADEARGRLGDPRLDRQPILRRRLDDATGRGCRRAPGSACAGSAWRTASARRPRAGAA